jgi:ABC-type multidrug transport system fused ATPase/permease subunit
MYTINLIKPFLESNKSILIIYLIFGLLSHPLESIVIPELFGSFFAEVKSNSNINYSTFFYKVIFFTLFVNICYSIMGYLDSIIIPKFNEYIVNHIYKKLLLYYQNSYDDLELGKIISRLNTLPNIIRELTTDLFSWLLPRILSIIVINIYLFYIDPKLAMISSGLFIILLVYNFMSYNTCIKISEDRYKKFEDRAEETQDKLSNLFAIYSSGNVKEEIKNYEKINTSYRRSYTKSILCSSKIKFVNNLVQCLIFVILNGLIIYNFKNNKITFAKMISLNMIVGFYLQCISSVMTSLPDYTNHVGIIKSVDEFLGMLEHKEDNRESMVITKGDISIKNLSFAYDNKNEIFNNFSLNIKHGEKIGILGESGNGKSTLIKLIMGYFKSPNNSIFIDDKDINNYNSESIRKQITYINQNTKLFNETIYYNIKYGNNLTNEQIDKLIDKFKLNTIFSNLDDGFNTNVGVNGDKLSGGQKQIIQLLRILGHTFLKKSINLSDGSISKNKIIILDEPTAAVDPKTKEIIIEIINYFSVNCTLILVTHDISNLKLVNRYIKISKGKIIEDAKTKSDANF